MKSLLASLVLLLAFSAFGQVQLIAVKKDGKWGYVDPTGKNILPFKFDDAWAFNNGLALAVEGGQFGLIDTMGKWYLARRNGKASGEFTSNRIVCSDENGKWGAIDKAGKTKVTFRHDVLGGFLGNWAVAGKKTVDPTLMSVSVIDTLGNEAVSFDNIYLPLAAFANSTRVRDGYLTVLVDGDYGKSLTPSPSQLQGRPLYIALLDLRNKRLVNLRLPSLQAEVREGRYNFSVDGISYSLATPLSAEPTVNEARFSFLAASIFPFSSAISAIDKDGKWAFVDKDGSLLSETNLPTSDYTNATPLYSGGFMMFKKKSGEWIYTDLKGVQRIALEFEEMQPFQSAAAVVKYKGKYGLIQKDGTWVLDPVYEAIRF
jgi:hypothetical protein